MTVHNVMLALNGQILGLKSQVHQVLSQIHQAQGGGMPSTVRFLTTLFVIISVSMVAAYILATLFEPNPREIRHEILGLTVKDE